MKKIFQKLRNPSKRMMAVALMLSVVIIMIETLSVVVSIRTLLLLLACFAAYAIVMALTFICIIKLFMWALIKFDAEEETKDNTVWETYTAD